MSSLIAEATDTDDQSPVKTYAPLNSFALSISLNAGFIFVFLTRNYFCLEMNFTFRSDQQEGYLNSYRQKATKIKLKQSLKASKKRKS